MFPSRQTARRLVVGAALALGAAAPALAASANEQAETAAVQGAKITPAAAIGAAEAAGGGRAVSFGFEHSSAVNAYQVMVATPQNTLAKVDVDPTTGAATRTGTEPGGALAGDGLPASALAQAAAAPTTLAQAVRSAEGGGAGRALEAGYILSGGRLAISVDLVGGAGGAHTVGIYAKNGQVIQVARQVGPQDATGPDTEHGGQRQHEGQGPDREPAGAEAD